MTAQYYGEGWVVRFHSLSRGPYPGFWSHAKLIIVKERITKVVLTRKRFE